MPRPRPSPPSDSQEQNQYELSDIVYIYYIGRVVLGFLYPLLNLASNASVGKWQLASIHGNASSTGDGIENSSGSKYWV